MKKLFVLLTTMLVLAACGEDYDDSVLTGRVDDLENRVVKLEELCKQMNTNIAALQTLMEAVEKKDYVTGVAPIVKDGEEVGYTITFTLSEPITIYHGKDGVDGEDGKDGEDGVDGKDGDTPLIGVSKDTDGIYYWTLNGEWLLDEDGNKVKAVGTDGKDGEDGTDGDDGSSGSHGSDGITPKLKIENNTWYVSYNNGSSWEALGSAVMGGGSNGGGTSSDNTFANVTVTSDIITFTLSNGTSFVLPRYKAVTITLDTDEQGITAGTSVRIPYTLTNATAQTKVSVASDGNYKVKLENQTTTSGEIVVTAPDKYTDGYINVLVSDRDYTSLNVINFYEWKMSVSGQEGEESITYSVSTDGGDVTIPLDTNFDYDIEIPTEVSGWVSATIEGRAVIRQENLILKVKPNTTLTARKCVVRLKPKRGTEAFIEIVIQQSSAIFSIDKSRFIAKAAGEVFTAKIQSSAGLKVNIPSADNWITSSVTSTGDDYTLSLTVSENQSTERRSSVIELYSTDGNTLLTTIDVAQLAIDEDALKDLVFLVSANVANDFTVYLPTDYKGIDCIVDWGDGTKEHIVYNSKEPRDGISHIYEGLNSATEFEVRVSGYVPRLSSGSIPAEKRSSTILAVKQWGNTGLVDVHSAFKGITSLQSISSDDLGAFTNVELFYFTFSDCINLTSIPENLFAFAAKATDFYYTFSGCSNITSIPEKLFLHNTEVTCFEAVFGGCNITSIPVGLFQYNVKVERFGETFNECKSLASIPERLFQYNTKVNSFYYTFKGCNKLTSIPEDLFVNCTEVTNFNSTFSECSNLITVPERLFVNCTKVTDFYATFQSCNLTSIPQGLFDNNRKVLDFSATFFNNGNLSGESSYTMLNGEKVHLYERYKYPTEFVTPNSFSSCFSRCINLDDYENIPYEWGGR